MHTGCRERKEKNGTTILLLEQVFLLILIWRGKINGLDATLLKNCSYLDIYFFNCVRSHINHINDDILLINSLKLSIFCFIRGQKGSN